MRLTRLLLYAAAGFAGTAIALSASQEPARADDTNPPGTISSILDTVTGSPPADKPTPVRDTVKAIADAVDKTVGDAAETVKDVTDTVDKVVEPLPVVGDVADKVTDGTLNTVTDPTATQPEPAPDGTDPDKVETPAADTSTTPPPTSTMPSGPNTAPELAEQPPRAAISGVPTLTVTAAQPTPQPGMRAERPTAVRLPRTGAITSDQPAPADGPDLGDCTRTPAATGSVQLLDGLGADTSTTSRDHNPTPCGTDRRQGGRTPPPQPPSG
ncbi:hypothetical protein [Verrucosispora sp. NA02020]|uniref:hypothetical protein n=1 Tax=Verrucosispora sp. NA02020 TaxID=2742132 RepID=UPI001590EB23|nr:hypothetical protein [Verrucosispora sp. NA02020]QKW15481.1 hypothetical protein HUT12_23720 [Verrucosispora sp. NA02020]